MCSTSRKQYRQHAIDHEPVDFDLIYVAPADRRLILENGFVRVTRGPKESAFCPAVDSLFRSAEYSYGPRVIGIRCTG